MEQQAAQSFAAGWYPDPYNQGWERWYDGIAWSHDYARPQQVQQAAQPMPMMYAAAAAPKASSSGIPTGVIPMVIAVILGLLRIDYAIATFETPVESAYRQGSIVGTLFGFVLTGLLFSWGFNRYRSAKESPTGEASDFSTGQLLPLALAIAAGGMGIAYVLAQ